MQITNKYSYAENGMSINIYEYEYCLYSANVVGSNVCYVTSLYATLAEAFNDAVNYKTKIGLYETSKC